jgi:hypothetical protein
MVQSTFYLWFLIVYLINYRFVVARNVALPPKDLSGVKAFICVHAMLLISVDDVPKPHCREM